MLYEFDRNHIFHEQMVVFTTGMICFQALFNLREVKKEIQSLLTIVRTAHILPRDLVFTVEMPDKVFGVGKVADNLLLNANEFTNALQQSLEIPTIEYQDLPPSQRPDTSKYAMKFPPSVLIHTSQVCIGTAYEKVSDVIKSKWGETPSNWPRLLDYFRHMRNASFHGNSFNIVLPRGCQYVIDIANPPCWRTSIMQDDKTIHGKPLIEGFIGIGDVPILLGDIANLLKD